MIATLKFDLPTEQEEFNNANNGFAYWSIIWEFLSYLRNQIKYAEIPAYKRTYCEEMQNKIWELIKEEGLENEF